MSPTASPGGRQASARGLIRHEAGESAIATLTRLKAQTSMSSLRASSVDNSFTTVNSSVKGKWGEDEDDAEDDEEEESLRGEVGSSAWTLAPSLENRSPDPAQVEASIRPGAPPPRDWGETLARTALLDSYVQSIVFQSGIDNERRPIVVLSSPALPDPKEVNYDDLLTRIMDQMELFVQNEYTVVFFAGGSSHRPPWAWLWSAYRRLSRPFRKNCRRLFICHPTFFTRSLVRIVSTGSAVLSPKFAKKITQVKSLSELAEKIDLTQIDIPPDVLKWNMHYEKEVKIPARLAEEKNGFLDAAGELVSTSSKLFGVPLDVLMGEKGEKGGIPRVVKDCVEELQRTTAAPHGGETGSTSLPTSNLDTEGLFRKSGSTALLQAAQQAYDRGSPVSLKQYDDAHIPAGLLKLYFRSLPDPIFSLSMYPLIRKCPPVEEGDEDSVRDAIIYLQDVIFPAILPQSKLILLSYVLEVLHKVSRRSERNKMDATNLATVWGPNLVRSSDPLKDMSMCAVAGAPKMSTAMPRPGSTGKPTGGDTPPTTLGTLLKLCIDRYYEIFELDYLDYEPPTYHPAELFEEGLQTHDDPTGLGLGPGVISSSTPPLLQTRQLILGQHVRQPSIGSNSTSATGMMMLSTATTPVTSSFPGSPLSPRRPSVAGTGASAGAGAGVGAGGTSPWPSSAAFSTPMSPSRRFSAAATTTGSTAGTLAGAGGGASPLPRNSHRRMLSTSSSTTGSSAGVPLTAASGGNGGVAVSKPTSSSGPGPSAASSSIAAEQRDPSASSVPSPSSSSQIQPIATSSSVSPPTLASTSASASITSPNPNSNSSPSIGLGFGLGPLHHAHARGLGNPMSVGRSASGSLKLTRARMGSASVGSAGAGGGASAGGAMGAPSNGNASGSFSSLSTSASGSGSGAGAGAVLTGRDGIPTGLAGANGSGLPSQAGTTSGVALTGASALGFFTTSGPSPLLNYGDRDGDDENEGGEGEEVQAAHEEGEDDGADDDEEEGLADQSIEVHEEEEED